LHLDYTLIIIMIGTLIVLNMLIKSWLEQIRVPSLVGFLLIGVFIRFFEDQYGIISPAGNEIFELFAKIGLITLLFRVGLESDLQGLLKQLRSASLVWIGDVVLSGLFGFIAAYYVLGVPWVTGIIVATAFTATSVGISVAVWEEANALNAPNGELLIDIAELDDISAVVLMALLFALLPHLSQDTGSGVYLLMGKTVGIFLLKIFGFGLLCFLFSRFVEKPMTTYFKNLEPPSDFILVVVGIGFVIAALAAWMAFSLAIGAFFAGLVFSRDEEAVKREGSFMPLYELFSPFFFIGIGMHVDPAALGSALKPGAVLAAVAFAAKIMADGLPVWVMRGLSSALLIGMSMVPRAEIAMVIMQRGLNKGAWAVPPEIFNAMVMVTILTCILAPLIVQLLLNRWPQTEEARWR